jgi:hypothetical protein
MLWSSLSAHFCPVCHAEITTTDHCIQPLTVPHLAVTGVNSGTEDSFLLSLHEKDILHKTSNASFFFPGGRGKGNPAALVKSVLTKQISLKRAESHV